MSWIDKILPAGISRAEGSKRASVPEGVWTKCVKCEAVLYRPDLERNANVCPKCDHHMRLGARQRLDLFLDPAGREEVFKEIEPIDRLRFRDKKKYVARLAAAQKSTGERDALVAIRGTLHGLPVVTVAFEFSFHGGSMGQAVGEKFSQAAQLALRERIPLICFAASGGARMQEALISLMQMAKTSAVIERMHQESVPYVSVLTDPIYGGVSASLALLGDFNIAEPDARAGFAGPNIIEQTIRQKLPKGFQRSEFLMEHGAIDMIVERAQLRDTIARLLAKVCGAPPIVPVDVLVPVDVSASDADEADEAPLEDDEVALSTGNEAKDAGVDPAVQAAQTLEEESAAQAALDERLGEGADDAAADAADDADTDAASRNGKQDPKASQDAKKDSKQDAKADGPDKTSKSEASKNGADGDDGSKASASAQEPLSAPATGDAGDADAAPGDDTESDAGDADAGESAARKSDG